MIEPIVDYDPAAALETEEAIAVFLDDALETGDAVHIADAVEVAARARGMITAKNAFASDFPALTSDDLQSEK